MLCFKCRNDNSEQVELPQSQEIQEKQEVQDGVAASMPRREITKEQILAAYGVQGDPSEALNDRAVEVMKRMSDKLTGRDFLPDGYTGECDSVMRQVRRLIQQATAHENLCQSYIGWCPWW